MRPAASESFCTSSDVRAVAVYVLLLCSGVNKHPIVRAIVAHDALLLPSLSSPLPSPHTPPSQLLLLLLSVAATLFLLDLFNFYLLYLAASAVVAHRLMMLFSLLLLFFSSVVFFFRS